MVRRAGLLAVAAVVLAGVADAQYVRPARMDETGWLAMGAPAGATTGCVGIFLGSPLNLQCAPSSGIVYTVATKSLDVTDGRVQAGNLRAIPLPASGSVTVTNQGTAGATTYTYSLQACLADGSCNAAGPASTTTTGNATLSATNFNRLSWSDVPGSALYKIRRVVGGATQGVIWSGTALTVDDTGLAGDSSAKPTVDETGTLTGRGVLATGTTVTPGTGTGTAVARVGGVLHVYTTKQTTTGTVEEVLATYTLPANTLARDGQAVRITAWGDNAANTNGKTERIRVGGIGGTVVAQRASAVSGAIWRIDLIVVRTGAATQVSSALLTENNALSTWAAAPTATLSGAVDIVVTGETPTAAGDLTFKGLIVEALN